MRDIEQTITPLVESQFPDFYREYGAHFIDFVKEYYAWMETSQQALNVSRNLLDIRDIDKTSEEFVNQFKQKYIKGLPSTVSGDDRLLTKHAIDLYRAKGTERGAQLVIQGMFDQEATIYYPGDDVFKTSDGTWVKPQYLELSMSPRTKTYVGREIIGSTSQTKAFAESLVRRRIGTKFVDVLYLSDVRGEFVTGDAITTTTDTSVADAPTVVGSMTSLDVVTGGANFRVGDIFTISSVNGKQGLARVSEISNQTGKVTFKFVDALTNGGWGYTMNASVLISSKVLGTYSKSNPNTQITDFQRLEVVSQSLTNVGYSTASPNNNGFSVGTVIENYYANGMLAANAVIVATSRTTNTTGYIIVAPNVGNVASVDTTFAVKGNTTTAVITSYADRTANGTVNGSNTGFLGVVSVTGGGFIATPYANVVGLTSNTRALVNTISTGTDASFSIGSLTDTENVYLTPDLLSSNNTQNVVFQSIKLLGNNSGAALQYVTPQLLSTGNYANGGFGFAKYPASNMDSILLDCLRFDMVTLGSIASITSINPGNEYNADPFVTIYEQDVAGYDKHDYVMNIDTLDRVFVVGEQIQQSYETPATQLTVKNFTGTAANGTVMTTVVQGEFVYQANSTAAQAATGFVIEAGISAGNGSIKVANVTGTFVANTTYPLRTRSSNATANITATALTTVSTTARAYVKAGSNTTVLKLKRINMENTFLTNHTVIGRSSGATANVVGIEQDKSTLPIGLNANVSANVQAANGVVTSMTVYDSGFGYIDNETVTLTKEGSAFEVTAKVSLGKQGVGSGYFSSTRSFLDSDKKLHDNDYYQEYSYEVQTKIPFDQYIDVLKQITHVAGTKAFGRVVSISKVNTAITASTTRQ